jgi:Putative zinc-finger
VKSSEAPLPPPVDTRDVTCEWVHDNAPAHALGALEPDEAELFERHLLLCVQCEDEAAELMRVGSLIGASVALSDPPASLKRNLLAAIRVSDSQMATPYVIPATPVVADAAHSPVYVLLRRGWLSRRLVVAPIVGAFLLLGLWSIGIQQQLDSRENDVARLERENEALAVHLSSIQAGQLAFASTGIWYPLSNTNASANGAGGIVMSGSQDTTTLLSVWNMPVEHDSYHIICESKRGELLAAGKIQVNERGTGTVTLTLPAPLSEYRAVHVVPTDSMPEGVNDLTNDILQLLLIDPTAIATGES